MASNKDDKAPSGAAKAVSSNNNYKQGSGGTSSSSSSSSAGGSGGKALLSVRYPVNSSWEFTLPNDEIAAGTVYCTDEVSQIVVLQKALVHSTLTFEVRMVQVASIKKEKLVCSSTENSTNSDMSMSKPLPVVQKKVLEEREKRAIKLAEESFLHINQNATPEGQAVFDRLLKACNHVVWEGESILVSEHKNIQVDPPYKQENCKIVNKIAGSDAFLDRVKKIVAAVGSAGGSF